MLWPELHARVVRCLNATWEDQAGCFPASVPVELVRSESGGIRLAARISRATQPIQLSGRDFPGRRPFPAPSLQGSLLPGIPSQKPKGGIRMISCGRSPIERPDALLKLPESGCTVPARI